MLPSSSESDTARKATNTIAAITMAVTNPARNAGTPARTVDFGHDVAVVGLGPGDDGLGGDGLGHWFDDWLRDHGRRIRDVAVTEVLGGGDVVVSIGHGVPRYPYGLTVNHSAVTTVATWDHQTSAWATGCGSGRADRRTVAP